jgi:ABC-type proline/glycine betaine transport system substrate-binding protein
METWISTKQDSLQKYYKKFRAVDLAGSVGYNGQEGWFVPRWIADQCGAVAYTSWQPGRDGIVKTAFAHSNEVANCENNVEEQTCCCNAAGEDCKIWCRQAASPQSQVLVHIVRDMHRR